MMDSFVGMACLVGDLGCGLWGAPLEKRTIPRNAAPVKQNSGLGLEETIFLCNFTMMPTGNYFI